MRNIYDIITEQKAIVDINMASYDLNYTVNHFMDNQDDYYIQEGIGEGIKKAAKGLVEFIKAIIQKIRELIKRFVGFLTGSKGGKNLEKELNDKIAKANEKADEDKKDDDKKPEDSKSDEKPKEGNKSSKSQDKKEEVKPGAHSVVSDLHHLLTTSFVQVTCQSFGPLETKLEFVGKFTNSYNILLLDGIQEIERSKQAPTFKSQVLDKLLYADEDDELIPELKSHFLDTGKTATYKAFQIGERVYEYIKETNETVNIFKKAEDAIVKHLNELARDLGGASAGSNAQLTETYIRNACSVVSTVMNYCVQSTLNSYQICAKIARQVTGAYAEVRNPGFKYEEE